MAKKALSLRIDEGLLERVRARADELGQSQTTFVVRALERALGPEPKDAPVPGVERPAAPPRAPGVARAMAAAEEPSMRQQYVEGALEKAERVEAIAARAAPSAPRGRVVDRAALERQARLNKAREKKS
jgi:hypothetical protein